MLKKLAIVLGVLLLLTAGGVYWLWHQATALPSWYTEGDPSEYGGAESDPAAPVAPPQWIAVDERGAPLPQAEPIALAPSPTPPGGTATETAPARPRRSARPPPKRHELRGFHVRRGKDGKRKSSPAIKASRATYEGGALEIGVILDLSRLPKDELGPRDRGRYDRAITNFPGITKRDVWVGVHDRPISVGGYLQLSAGAEVHVGKLSYSLTSAAKRMGMSPIELRLELNRTLRRLGFVDPAA